MFPEIPNNFTNNMINISPNMPNIIPNISPNMTSNNPQNNISYNLMNANDNSLYIQNFQQMWNYMMQQNAIKEDLNKMNNILSLINLPVLLPYHSKHPLINCKTPQRAKISPSWKCNWCGKDYSYDVPTFYCTCCDFDLCQKCLLSLYAFQIVIYNYNMETIIENEIINNKFFKPNIHNHPLVPILREASYYTSDLRCNFCLKEIPNIQEFYYCSLCNHCVCQFCYNNMMIQEQSNHIRDNEEYLSGDQLKSN